MNDNQLLERITIQPEVMTGRPVIKGSRLTVDFILNLIAHGSSFGEIITEYKGLTEDDLRACILFASLSLQNTEFMPLSSKVA